MKTLLAAGLILLLSSVAWCEESAGLQTFQVFYENDLFGDTDKYYTNALQMTWLSKDLKRYKDDVRLPQWFLPVIRAVPFAHVPGSTHNIGLLFGHQIYTPSDIRAAKLLPDDRPYAGNLYAGIALHSKTLTKLDTIEITLGVVGPSALGEQVQNTVHDLRDIAEAQGWDNQLDDEVALGFAWQRKWRTHRAMLTDWLCYDLLTHTGVTLGNVKTGADAGGEVRVGYNIPMDFGSDVIRAGAGVSAPVSGLDYPRIPVFGMHLFAGARAGVVLRDIFLDGNTFSSSHSVDKKPFVAEFSTGIAVSYKTIKLTYRHVFRTEQFDHQSRGHVVGSLALTVSF
ncbi:MAG: lipid A deacylase LpxR family protein [Desulfotignum sp.]|nr:lipid A deacylase LpxR family protein [Desulfotignum sp.]